MSLSRKIMMLVILGACAVTAAAQEKHRVTVNANGDMVPPQGMEEYLRRRLELLKNPDFIKLELARLEAENGEQGGEKSEAFKSGKKVRLRLLMMNTLSEPFIIDSGSDHNNTRPLLLRDGQELPYHEAAKLIETKQKIFNRVHGRSITLRPGKTQSVGIIDLSKWYEPLKLGRYLLTVQYRVEGSEKWIESPPMTFEVEPE